MGRRVAKSPKCLGISVVTLCYIGHITVITLGPSLWFIGYYLHNCAQIAMTLAHINFVIKDTCGPILNAVSAGQL